MHRNRRQCRATGSTIGGLTHTLIAMYSLSYVYKVDDNHGRAINLLANSRLCVLLCMYIPIPITAKRQCVPHGKRAKYSTG